MTDAEIDDYLVGQAILLKEGCGNEKVIDIINQLRAERDTARSVLTKCLGDEVAACWWCGSGVGPVRPVNRWKVACGNGDCMASGPSKYAKKDAISVWNAGPKKDSTDE